MNSLTCLDSVSGDLSARDVQEKIEALELQWRKLPQIDIPVTHRHSGGIYVREIIIPKDTLLTGRVYVDDHFDVMVYGDVTVSSDAGRKRFSGFNIFAGNRGKKRAGYAHKETKWLTFHSCKKLKDSEYLKEITCGSFSELPAMMARSDYVSDEDILKSYKEVGFTIDYASYRAGFLAASGKKSKRDMDVIDYHNTLSEFGISAETAISQAENESDMTEVDGDYGVEVGPSVIAGDGLWAKKEFSAGETIMPARISGKRTIAGRYTNHSFCPNAKMVFRGDNVDLVAIGHIFGGEITVSYRDALSSQITRGVQCPQ